MALSSWQASFVNMLYSVEKSFVEVASGPFLTSAGGKFGSP